MGQPVPLCDRDVICILGSQHGRSVWGSLGQVGAWRDGKHGMVKLEGNKLTPAILAFTFPAGLKHALIFSIFFRFLSNIWFASLFYQ